MPYTRLARTKPAVEHTSHADRRYVNRLVEFITAQLAADAATDNRYHHDLCESLNTDDQFRIRDCDCDGPTRNDERREAIRLTVDRLQQTYLPLSTLLLVLEDLASPWRFQPDYPNRETAA
jgi:hypothetical protein